MSDGSWRWLLLLTACLLLTSPAGAQTSQRIVAVGDLHGDYSAWHAISRAAGLVDAKGRWSGGQTILVQTGDIVDRAPDSLRIINELVALQRQAPRSGGRVLVLTGNHEAMMVTGDLRYVHPGEYAAFATRASPRLREALYEQQRAAIEARAKKLNPAWTPQQIRKAYFAQTPLGYVEHREAWGPSGRLGRWVIGNPVAAKVGDTLFVHGGISTEYARFSLAALNRRAATELSAATQDEGALINDPLGPLWYRGLVTRQSEDDDVEGDGKTPPVPNPVRVPARPSIEQELASVLSTYGVKRIVVGHTPSLRGIVMADGGKLLRIDSGNSRYYNGQLSYLEIVGDKVVPHTVVRPPARAAR
jgi:hypothetical protein